MNYRHSFHAGNHADVLKHSTLAAGLATLTADPAPFFAIDTHAGRGGYDLATPEALRAGEFRLGIGRLLAAREPPAALAPYLAAVRAANPGGALIAYPGSPLLIARALRQADRLAACELNPDEAKALAAALKPYKGAKAETRDGYAALRTLPPPHAGRCLVLIDPPFERRDELEAMAAALADGLKRWPQGLFMLWYALKDKASADAFLEYAGTLAKDVRSYELAVRTPEGAPGLVASGMLVVNGGPKLDAMLRQVGPYLERTLAQGPGAAWRAKVLIG